jgi:hypothetical protein
MAPANFSNLDYGLFYDDCGNLFEALKPVVSVPQPVRRGVRRQQAPVQEATSDVPALEAAFQESLGRILSSPQTKAQPKGHGIIPLKAIHPCRKLYEALVKMARLGDESAPTKVDDNEIPFGFDGLLGRFIDAIDPDHPFLPLDKEEEKKVDAGGAESEDPNKGQQELPPNESDLALRPRRKRIPVDAAEPRRSRRLATRDAYGADRNTRMATFERYALPKGPRAEEGESDLEFNFDMATDDKFVADDNEPVTSGPANEEEEDEDEEEGDDDDDDEEGSEEEDGDDDD